MLQIIDFRILRIPAQICKFIVTNYSLHTSNQICSHSIEKWTDNWDSCQLYIVS